MKASLEHQPLRLEDEFEQLWEKTAETHLDQ